MYAHFITREWKLEKNRFSKKHVIVSDYYSFFKYVSYDFAGGFKRFYFLFYQLNNQIGSWFFLYS